MGKVPKDSHNNEVDNPSDDSLKETGSAKFRQLVDRLIGTKRRAIRFGVIAGAVVVVVVVLVLMLTLFGERTMKFGQVYTWRNGPTCVVMPPQPSGSEFSITTACENTKDVIIDTKYGRPDRSRTSNVNTDTYMEIANFVEETTITVIPIGYKPVTWGP